MCQKPSAVDERERRAHMVGLCLSQTVGFESARDHCGDTVLFVADLDTDEMLFFSNLIGLDVEHVEETAADTLSGYWHSAVEAYVHPDYRDRVRPFMDNERLRENCRRGLMTESLEYPCVVAGDIVWVRACYELGQRDDGHVQATCVLIDMTRFHAPDDLDRTQPAKGGYPF